ncbi:hypothetical protein ABEF95_015918 [Exophiala dermatitidis]
MDVSRIWGLSGLWFWPAGRHKPAEVEKVDNSTDLSPRRQAKLEGNASPTGRETLLEEGSAAAIKPVIEIRGSGSSVPAFEHIQHPTRSDPASLASHVTSSSISGHPQTSGEGRPGEPGDIIWDQPERPTSQNGADHPRWGDIVRALETIKNTNQQVTDTVGEWNASRTALFFMLETTMQSLDAFTQRMTGFANDFGLPSDLTSRFEGVREDFERVYFEFFAPLHARQEVYTEAEMDIIHKLYRCDTLLDRLIAGHTDISSPASPSRASPAAPAHTVDENLLRFSPLAERYQSQLHEVDNILETLEEGRVERAHLMQEQESRARLGLTLDPESLQSLASIQESEPVLLEELDYAELVLGAIRCLMHDEEASQVPEDGLLGTKDDVGGPLKPTDPMSSLDSSRITSANLQKLQLPSLTLHRLETLQTRSIKFADNLTGPMADPIDRSNFFVDLFDVDNLPGHPLLRKTPVEMEHFFLHMWFNDGSDVDFAHHHQFAKDHGSKLVYVADSVSVEHSSDSSFTRKPASLPLLRLDPSTTSQDIISRASQTRKEVRSSVFYHVARTAQSHPASGITFI